MSTLPRSPSSLSHQDSWNCCNWPLRRKLRVLWLLFLGGITALLPLLILEMQQHSWSPKYAAWFLAGLFCILTLPVTMYEVALHLEYYSRPALQRHIIRILLMPPIYALDSWFCLRFINARTYLTPIRECYEAYTIYNFFMYLLRYLDGQLGPVSDYMAQNCTTVPHIFPMQYFSHQWSGKELYRNCRNGVLNYVILRPATAAVMWITLVSNKDKYEEGTFTWGNVWPYCMIINNFSQAWALYVLMLFYMAMHTELSPLNPLRKFVTIKLVVFFSFWQGLILTLLCGMNILKPTHESFRTYQPLSQADFSGGLQDFIICIEMFFAAIGFAWSFPPRDYMTGEHPGFWKSFYTLFDMADVVDDVQGRVHEEYKEFSTRPIQKIIAPIRNNPLFSKPPAMKGSPGDQELVPLTAGSARSDSVTTAPSVRNGSVPTPTRTAVTSPEASIRAGSTTGGSVQEQYSELPTAVSLDRNSSVSGDIACEQAAPATVGGSALAALMVKPHRSSGRGKASGTKLQSHVD